MAASVAVLSEAVATVAVVVDDAVEERRVLAPVPVGLLKLVA